MLGNGEFLEETNGEVEEQDGLKMAIGTSLFDKTYQACGGIIGP